MEQIQLERPIISENITLISGSTYYAVKLLKQKGEKSIEQWKLNIASLPLFKKIGS
jgi:hypothetical protein